MRKIAFASFPLPGKADSMDATDGERKRGLWIVVVMGLIDFDGLTRGIK
jgi:hypothetical protein